MTRLRAPFVALLLLAALLPACGDPPAHWQAIALPAVVPAARDGDIDPLVLRTLRLTLPDGSRRVQFSEEDEPALGGPGSTRSMRFTATSRFRRAGLLAATDGGDATVLLRLRDGTDGRPIAEARFGDVRDRNWLDLDLPEQAEGPYQLELTVERGTAGWWSQRLSTNDAAPAGFQIGNVPLVHSAAISVAVNARAARIAILGGVSSYDHGIGWWRDYEVQGDTGDRQFVGDEAGTIEIRYASGAVDRVPLIYGWTLWWRTHLQSEEWGGPFDQPFSSPEARAALDGALQLTPTGHPLAPFRLDLTPRPEPISSIAIVDSPAKQGVPIVAAISLFGRDQVAGAAPLDSAPGPDDKAIATRAATPPRQALAALSALLYRQTRPTVGVTLPAALGADLAIGGPGALLTGIWRANRRDLTDKFATLPPFHTSTPGAPNYGSYQGVGGWRDGAGYFAKQVWARDLGRAAIEVLRQGESVLTEPALVFAGDRLYDLPNGFPRYARDSELIPPHWTTVLGEPLYLDGDKRGDGNWENDSQALLVLAYWRAWQVRGNDPGWLARHAGTVRDASDWFLVQLDRPDRWHSRDGLLWGEGEAANDGGYDVLSNTLAWRALLGAAEMSDSLGETDRAARYRSAAETIRAAVNRQLRDADGWRAVAWNWGYGHEALAPVFTAADVSDYDLSTLSPEERATAEQTYRRQLRRCPDLACVRAVGYGVGFLAQTALLLDDLDTAAQLLENLAALGYDERRHPFLVPEGIARSPDGTRWYRTGDLGNAVHQAEVLKALALVAGIENGPGGRLRLLPRLPAAWPSLTVTDWWTPSGPVSFDVQRDGATRRYRLDLPTTASLRVGPATGATVTVDGLTVIGRPTAGGWVWLDDLPAGRHEIVVTGR
ncbi:MAG: hypothetical protein U0556_14125 [Dehalococcoidia bacterium]